MLLSAGGSGGTGQLVLFVLGTLVIIVLAYYVTYLVAKGGSKSAQSKAIKVIDRRSLSKDKLICLIEVADTVYLVAMTDGGVSLLDTLEDEAAEVVRKQARTMPAFSGVVQKGIAKGFGAIFDKKKQDAEELEFLDLEEPEDLTVRPSGEGETPLRTARAEDDLDEMYRKLKGRQDKKKAPPKGGRGE